MCVISDYCLISLVENEGQSLSDLSFLALKQQLLIHVESGQKGFPLTFGQGKST